MKKTILYNGQIHVFDKSKTIASVLVIQGDKIIAVGDKIEAFNDSNAIKINLNNAVVIPGLTDGHIHTKQYALSIDKVDCHTKTRDECLKRIARKARTLQAGQWVLGQGWNDNLWDEGAENTLHLDSVSPNNPVFITAKSLHAAWCNSQALKFAKINENTQDPSGGKIERDKSGNPTGVLYESAVALVQKIIPQPELKDITEAINKAQQTLFSYGITSIHDFDGADAFRAFQRLNARGELKIRVTKNIPYNLLEATIQSGLESGFGNRHLKIGAIKLFADGALGTQTAAMIDPYQGMPNNSGMLLLNSSDIFEIGKKATTHNLPLAIHAIGDKAVREVIQGLEKVIRFEEENHIKQQRHRIEHLQLIHPDDIKYLNKIKFTASMQPIHAVSDRNTAIKYWGVRIENAYAWKTILQQGKGAINLAFGSDAPVESPNPFLGLSAATSFTWHKNSLKNNILPSQNISLYEAITAYTYGCAYASSSETTLGKLLPGFNADLILLDKNFFSFHPDEIAKTHPLATMIDGKWVYQNREEIFLPIDD